MFVYILTNVNDSVLYIGVTNDLMRRLDEHRCGAADGFTKKYQCTKLIYYEQGENIMSALEREKQLKNWSRAKQRVVDSNNESSMARSFIANRRPRRLKEEDPSAALGMTNYFG